MILSIAARNRTRGFNVRKKNQESELRPCSGFDRLPKAGEEPAMLSRKARPACGGVSDTGIYWRLDEPILRAIPAQSINTGNAGRRG